MANSKVISDNLRRRVLRRFAEDGPESGYALKSGENHPAYSSIHETIKHLLNEKVIELVKEDKNEKGAPRKIYGLTLDGLIAVIGYEHDDDILGRHKPRHETPLALGAVLERYQGLFPTAQDASDVKLLKKFWRCEWTKDMMAFSCHHNDDFMRGFPESFDNQNPLQRSLVFVVEQAIHEARMGFYPYPERKADFNSFKKDARFMYYADRIRDKKQKELASLDGLLG
jgi:hypothetical protein